MNKERRKRIESAMKVLEELAAEVEEIAVDEEGAYYNMPESIQDSERGERMQEVMDELNDISTELSDMIERLQGCL